MGNVCTSSGQELAFEPLQSSSEAPSPCTGQSKNTAGESSACRQRNCSVLERDQQEQGTDAIFSSQGNESSIAGTSDLAYVPVQAYKAKRRGSVSAEVAALAAQNFEQHLPRKDSETEKVVLQAMTYSFLFTGLEQDQKIECISSMFRQDVQAGDTLIRQGDEGDNFYVIGEGTFAASIRQPDLEEKTVCTYEGKGAFGELALMYNCPRAASVKEGVYILTEGESMNGSSKFYMLEEGKVGCYRNVMGEKRMVKEIGHGGFFGEVALVTKASTRIADCVALSRCKVLALGKDAFERLMGPADEILRRGIEDYERVNEVLLRDAQSELNLL